MIYDTFDSSNKTISIPVRFVKGKIEYFYGGKLPKLKDGVIGELILPSYAVEDKKFLVNISKENIVDLLPSGTKLFVEININNFEEIDEVLKQFVIYERCSFIEITLQEKLKLKLRGTKKPQLLSAKCDIPALGKVANSLNHAYSLISQAYEIERISHIGNVFKKVYYYDDFSYHELDTLRGKFQYKYEEDIGISIRDWQIGVTNESFWKW